MTEPNQRRKPRSYTDEFKKQLIDLYHSGKGLRYNKHNLRKASNHAAFTGYAYFLFIQQCREKEEKLWRI